jgi:CBS domain containing-hemolysin-like protein
MQESLVVPDTVPLPQLLKTFRETQRHLAIVVDEYGSVEGIVTLEDVLEEVVGDIRDESDLPVEEFLEQEDGTLIVRGNVDMRKLCARLGITWDPELEVSTISGLVTETLERIPVAGDAIDWNGYHIEVLRADRRRARLLSVRGM